MYKYPFQIGNAFSNNAEKNIMTTLGIEARLSLEDGSEQADSALGKINPLEMHSGYSRFVVTLIRKNANATTTVYANIPATDDADLVLERTKSACSVIMNRQFAQPAQTSQQSADVDDSVFSTKFGFGNLKGKSPAEVILENKNGEQELIIQQEFLQTKVAEYPANQKMIDAIARAIALNRKGKLAEMAASRGTQPNKDSNERIVIYEADFKPLESTYDEKEKTVMVYKIGIYCYPDKKYPFEIVIGNSYPKYDKANRKPSFSRNDKHDEVSIKLTEAKWVGLTAHMGRLLDAFVTFNYRLQNNKANGSDKSNRAKAEHIRKQEAQSNQ